MQFLAQISGLLDVASGLAAIGGALIVLASMAIAARAWRQAARKITRLERGIGELETAQSQRLRKLEDQIGKLQAGVPVDRAVRADSAGVTPFLAKLSSQKTGEPDAASSTAGNRVTENGVSGESNIVPLRAARSRDRNQQARNRVSVEDIRLAIAEGRLEGWYQPIVGLPGRTPRYYECHACLRLESGETVSVYQGRTGPAAQEVASEAARAMLVECFGLARKLRREKRDGSVIWPVWADALADSHEHERIMALLSANTSLRSRFLIGVDIAEYDNADEAFEDRLHQFRELGFKFMLAGGRNLDRVSKCADTGLFSLVTLPHQTILANSFERGASVASRLHAADPGHHIEIAATGIELEETAIELIDCDVMLAQGTLFSEPRPLRKNAPAPDGAASRS